MNHCVPDFEVDDDYLLPACSSLKRHKKSAMGDEDIMELLWQNGQVVMQSQNQRSAGNKKSETTPSSATREIRSGVNEDETTPCNLFMQEDEMVSWLHYPNEDNSLDLYLHNNEIMYPVLPSSAPVTTASSSLPPPPPLVTIPSSRPPIPPMKRVEEEQPIQPKFANFLHFSRPSKGNQTGSAPSSSNKMSQATVVESNNRSAAEAQQSRASRVTDSVAFVSAANVGCRGGSMSSFGGAGTSFAGQEPETCDLSASSSPVTGGSGASASVEPSSQKPPPATDNRKRKGRDTDDTECYSEDEYHELAIKKQSRGSMSTKRSRAAEVHNLSERRRRDRINEKMKALQELIPRCNKSDKASMLDEAIEYLKSLQMQVQMMSMGYNMVPMMFPGVGRYMPTMPPMGVGMGMGMGMGLGLGMGMDHAGMNRPMVPFPTVLPGGSAMPNPTTTAVHMGPRFAVPRFQMPQASVMGPARTQITANPTDPAMVNSFPLHNNIPNQPRLPFLDPYQQYIGIPQTQLPQPQNLTGVLNNNKDVRNPEPNQPLNYHVN